MENKSPESIRILAEKGGPEGQDHSDGSECLNSSEDSEVSSSSEGLQFQTVQMVQ